MHGKMLAAAVTLGFVIVLAVLGGQAQAAKIEREFAGSEACRKCHKIEYDSWDNTWHSKMVQPPKGAILKDAVEKWGGDGAGEGPTIGNGTKTKFKLDDIKYVVGSRWKQRYLVMNDQTGGLQFLNKQFNRYTGKWENYGNANDWNSACAT